MGEDGGAHVREARLDRDVQGRQACAAMRCRTPTIKERARSRENSSQLYIIFLRTIFSKIIFAIELSECDNLWPDELAPLVQGVDLGEAVLGLDEGLAHARVALHGRPVQGRPACAAMKCRTPTIK